MGIKDSLGRLRAKLGDSVREWQEELVEVGESGVTSEIAPIDVVGEVKGGGNVVLPNQYG